MTQEELVVRGDQALALLNSEAFLFFIEDLKADLLTCIGNTEPFDDTTRNKLYYEHRGVINLMAHLAQYRATAESIKERNEAQRTESEAD